MSSFRLQRLSLNRASRHDSVIFQLALKATRKLWFLPLAANSRYRRSNLIFRPSQQSINFIKLSLSHASPQPPLRLSASSISLSLSRTFFSSITLPNPNFSRSPHQHVCSTCRYFADPFLPNYFPFFAKLLL